MEKHGVALDLEKQINDAHPHGSSGEVDDINLSLSLTTVFVSNDGDQLFPKKVIPFSLEECRVCNADMEEDLIDLGCQCKGGLAKAHRTCIDTWFRIRGSNQCEICNQTAANVPPPTSHPTVKSSLSRAV